MRPLTWLLLIACLATASSGWAQRVSEDRTIELRGGERVVVHADGTMSHYNSAGNRVPMPEGVVMVAQDGRRLMMKGQALWREILDVAATSYGRAVGGIGPNQRSIELKDGGRVVWSTDGTMVHYDAAGNRQRMADGVVMIAKDGRRILMGNGSLWSAEQTDGTPKAGR